MPFHQKKGAFCLDPQKGLGTAYEGHVWVSGNVLGSHELLKSLLITFQNACTIFVRSIYDMLYNIHYIKLKIFFAS